MPSPFSGWGVRDDGCCRFNRSEKPPVDADHYCCCCGDGRAFLCLRSALPHFLSGDRIWRHDAGERCGTGRQPDAVPREVSFNAHVVPGLKWKFEAPKGVSLKPGEETTILYRATNLSDQATTGTSTFNVTPNKIGPYFMKIDCFCFIEQTLQPGESVDMPVVFYLDPEIDTDINTAETPEITLSYTFFPGK